jgi:hypothetical protein
VNTAVMLRGLRLVKLLLLSRELFFGKMGFRCAAAPCWLAAALVTQLAAVWLARLQQHLCDSWLLCALLVCCSTCVTAGSYGLLVARWAAVPCCMSAAFVRIGCNAPAMFC